jgi:hypothetical protein
LLQNRGHLTSFLTAIAMSSPPISTAKGVNVDPRPPCISVKAPAPNIITPSNAKAKRSNRRSGLVRSLRFFTIRSCPLDFAQAYTRCFLNRYTQPKPGEPSICGHCAALVIFTDELRLRALDWPEWCLLTHAKKKNLVATRAVIAARIRAARQ